MPSSIPRVERVTRSRLRELLGFYKRAYNLELSNTATYRGAMLGWALLSGAPIVASIIVWQMVAVSGGETLAGRDASQIITYQFIAALLFALNTPWAMQSMITTEIRLGDMNAMLIRPMNYGAYCLAGYTGYSTLFLLFMIIPTGVMVALFYNYLDFASPARIGLFAAAALIGFAIQFVVTYCFSMLAFWWDEVGSFFFAYVLLAKFGAGETVPLWMLPDWLQSALAYTPFPSIASFPARLYLGEVPSAEILGGFVRGVLWVLGLSLVARYLWRFGVKRYGAFGD